MSVELFNEEFVDAVNTYLEDMKNNAPLFRFACIGSRECDMLTVDHIRERCMSLLAIGAKGISGGAEQGPDSSLTDAVRDTLKLKSNTKRGYELAEIYIGWFKFADHIPGDLDGAILDGSKQTMTTKAYGLASILHNAFDKCGVGAKALHARNCFQILGYTLDHPVDVVLYGATQRDQLGRVLGGTATAWKLATVLGIPAFDATTEEGRIGFDEWVNERIAHDQELIDIYNRKSKVTNTSVMDSVALDDDIPLDII